MITILNTSIVTAPGTFQMLPISLDQAKALLASEGYQSAVGHQTTAEILTELLGVPVAMNRIQYAQQPGETALVFKLKRRAPEGSILSRAEVDEIGYEFFRLQEISLMIEAALQMAGVGDFEFMMGMVRGRDSEANRAEWRKFARSAQ